MKSIQVAAAVIQRGSQILIARRPQDKHKGGYWEFPGGKIENGESPEAALKREILEELDIQITNPVHFQDIQFEYPEKKVELKFYLVENFDGEPKGMEGQPIEWVEISRLGEYQFPEANQPIVALLINQ